MKHNWRSHLLVNCFKCHKPMGHHKQSEKATCVTCQLKNKQEGK